MQRWTEYAVVDSSDPDEIEGGPFEARVSAESWASNPRNIKWFYGPPSVVQREMTAGDWEPVGRSEDAATDSPEAS